MDLLIAAVFGYLLGSIPFGLIFTQLAGLGDLRRIGSGNIGATNVLRTGHKGVAALTLAADILKGTAAVLLAPEFVGILAEITGFRAMGDTELEPGLMFAAAAGAYGAFLGHLFPIWLGFKGGKGVATYIGVATGMFWPGALAFVAAWLTMAFALRYSSLSALVAAVVAPIVVAVMGHGITAMIMAPLSLVLIAMHHQNIRRLASGREPKIGAKA